MKKLISILLLSSYFIAATAQVSPTIEPDQITEKQTTNINSVEVDLIKQKLTGMWYCNMPDNELKSIDFKSDGMVFRTFDYGFTTMDESAVYNMARRMSPNLGTPISYMTYDIDVTTSPTTIDFIHHVFSPEKITADTLVSGVMKFEENEDLTLCVDFFGLKTVTNFEEEYTIILKNTPQEIVKEDAVEILSPTEQKLVGEWNCTTSCDGLESIHFQFNREVSFIEKGEKFDKTSLELMPEMEASITYEVDDTTLPKSIKIIMDIGIGGMNKTKTTSGIMKFTDDGDLMLNMNFDGGEAPTGFSEGNTAILKRVGK